MQLRDYQHDILQQVMSAKSHDLVQLDTGGGKTPILAAIAEAAPLTLFVAHRNILIDQISGTLAHFGLEHSIIAAQHTVRRCVGHQRAKGMDAVRHDCAHRVVASIDSLIARHRLGLLRLDPSAHWLVLIDEAHHVLRDNKWGKLADILPHARFVGCTATPCRLDGRSLHKDKEGLFERLVQSESLRKDSVKTLIRRGYLSDFRIFSATSNADESVLRFSANTGDYTPQSLAAYVDRSTIMGDAVAHYQRLAAGKQAVAMCVTIRNAEELAERFRAAGIASACISSKMGATDVARKLDAFSDRAIQVLTNVDMVGEGFDVPGIEALIMTRKTASLVAYRQWIGRALRPSGDAAVIIDHVGNVVTHGLPDSAIAWDLRYPPKGSRTTNLVTCPKCSHTHYGWLIKCPHCGEPIDLRPKGAGAAYVDQRVVDVVLCEHRRKMLRRDEQFKTELVAPPNFWGSSSVDHVCRKLRARMIAALVDAGIQPHAINTFAHENAVNKREWWIDRFTIRDVDNPAKLMKVYKQWQSKSSTATPPL